MKLGEKIIHLEQVNSTNEFARELGSYIKPIHEGTIIIADHQYSGKGRKNKEWVSERGKNISMSIIVYPRFLDSGNIFYLSKTIALGIRDYLYTLGLDQTIIKWPNDIYIGDAKIAGILIENSWRGSGLQESIVGIGLNVNQTNFVHLDRPITSLKMARKKEFDIKVVFKELVQHLQNRLNQLVKMNYGLIDDDYRRALYGRKSPIHLEIEGKVIEARFSDVTKSGQAILVFPNKETREFNMDEVKFI